MSRQGRRGDPPQDSLDRPPGDQPFGRSPRRPPPERPAPARRLPATPPTLCLPLSTYYLLILLSYLYYLDLARVARVKRSVFRSIARSNVAASIGPATISSPFSGAGALRVVYAPFAFISFYLFFRNGTFQRVTAGSNKNPPDFTRREQINPRLFFLKLRSVRAQYHVFLTLTSTHQSPL
jgi:hypothetical protein